MGFSVVLASGAFGFLAAILSGLALGLRWFECLGVYAGAGLAMALAIYAVRALVAVAARRIA